MNAKLSTHFMMYEKFICRSVRWSLKSFFCAFLLHTTSTTKTFAINENKFYAALWVFLHVDSHKFECSHAMHNFFFSLRFSFIFCLFQLLANAKKNYYRDFISKKRKIYVKLNKKIIFPSLYLTCSLIFLNNKEENDVICGWYRDATIHIFNFRNILN